MSASDCPHLQKDGARGKLPYARNSSSFDLAERIALTIEFFQQCLDQPLRVKEL